MHPKAKQPQMLLRQGWHKIQEPSQQPQDLLRVATKATKSFKEQCILLATIFQLAPLHLANASSKKLPYKDYGYNANIPVEGEPFGFINRLTQDPGFDKFFDARQDQLAHLQPMIRLFKVTPNSQSGKEQKLEFPFDTFASANDVATIMKPQAARGFGANIESFNFAYDGSNPFQLKKALKQNLRLKQIIFQNY